jgi:DNA-binding MarR family transcriptional regulator
MADNETMALANQIYTFSALLLKYFSQGVEQRLEAYGAPLSGLQVGVLRMLQYETLTSSVLSQRMGIDPSSMMRVIDALERKGLAARGVDPHDRRRNPLQITPQGLALLKAVPAISEEDPTFQAIQALGPEQGAQLRDLLCAVVAQFPEGKVVAGLMNGQPGSGFERPVSNV